MTPEPSQPSRTEERLLAALAARAEQVSPERVSRLRLPPAPARRTPLRALTLAAAASVVALGAVAGGTALVADRSNRGGTEVTTRAASAGATPAVPPGAPPAAPSTRSPASAGLGAEAPPEDTARMPSRPPASLPDPVATPARDRDLDGDGTYDPVTVTREGDRVRVDVRLSTGSTISSVGRAGVTVWGYSDIDADGRAEILLDAPGGLSVFRYSGTDFGQVIGPDGQPFLLSPTAWQRYLCASRPPGDLLVAAPTSDGVQLRTWRFEGLRAVLAEERTLDGAPVGCRSQD